MTQDSAPEQQQDAGEKVDYWFAGDAFGLDADYSFVVRRMTRWPDKYNYGDEGDSEPVAICQSKEERDQIIADHAAARRARMLEEGIRKQGKCLHCQGTGEPNCVSCHNYQGCICRPGEGRYAERCWNCKGTGLNQWATALLPPATGKEEAR